MIVYTAWYAVKLPIVKFQVKLDLKGLFLRNLKAGARTSKPEGGKRVFDCFIVHKQVSDTDGLSSQVPSILVTSNSMNDHLLANLTARSQPQRLPP